MTLSKSFYFLRTGPYILFAKSRRGLGSPRSGTASDVGGDMSETMLRKKQIESSTVISKANVVLNHWNGDGRYRLFPTLLCSRVRL